MRIALRELRRRPRRFASATAALGLIVVLLLVLGALRDGLYLDGAGFFLKQEADVLVYSADARSSFLRSRIDAPQRAEIEAVDGVDTAHGLGLALVGATVPGREELADVAVVGYEGGARGVPDPPEPGQGYADRRLATQGVELGDRLGLGPARVPVEVIGWVSDSNYLLQSSVWVDPATWREVTAGVRPDAVLPDGTFQVLAVEVEPGRSVEAVGEAIDDATGGATETITTGAAVYSIPAIGQQNDTFDRILIVTFVIGGIVVALFFALLTLERTGLYGVLKAMGASSRGLFAGLLVQAAVIATVAFVLGAVTTLLLARVIPATVPVRFEPARAVWVAVGIVVTAVIGGAISLRRIVRIDPASAIGAGG